MRNTEGHAPHPVPLGLGGRLNNIRKRLRMGTPSARQANLRGEGGVRGRDLNPVPKRPGLR